MRLRRTATRHDDYRYHDRPTQRIGLNILGSHLVRCLYSPDDVIGIADSGTRADGPLPQTLPRRRTGRNQRRAVRVDRNCPVPHCGRSGGPEDLLGRRIHFRYFLVGQHFRARRELTPLLPSREAGERGSISVTGIVVFFALILLLVVGTNWVDDDLALGAFRTVVSEAAQTGALDGAPGAAQDACYEAAARAQTDLISGPLARDITITCTLEQLPSGAELLVAVAEGTLPDWVVPVTVHVHVVAQAPIEVSPAQPSTVDP
jgi:hypothetical protein